MTDYVSGTKGCLLPEDKGQEGRTDGWVSSDVVSGAGLDDGGLRVVG